MIYEYDLFKSATGIELISKRIVSKEDFTLNNPETVYDFCRKYYNMHQLAEETIILIGVNAIHVASGVFVLSKGNSEHAICDVSSVMKRLLLLGAFGFFIVHNHPSGNCTPSTQDDSITIKIKKASELLDLVFLDHIIIGDCYYSYAENKKLGG